MRSYAHAVQADATAASGYKKPLHGNKGERGDDSKLADLPPESLPPELDVVLQLAELVRLDRLVPRHDHLAHELPAESFMSNSNRHLPAENAPAATFRAMHPAFATIQHPAEPHFARHTHLLARHDVSSPSPAVRCGPARCMRVLPLEKPV